MGMEREETSLEVYAQLGIEADTARLRVQEQTKGLSWEGRKEEHIC